jgi:putative transcriptional regulator
MNKEAFLIKLGNNIRKLREEKEMSQTQLAHNCDKDPQSIERVENGKINPSVYYLSEIAKGLGVPLKKLLDF